MLYERKVGYSKHCGIIFKCMIVLGHGCGACGLDTCTAFRTERIDAATDTTTPQPGQERGALLTIVCSPIENINVCAQLVLYKPPVTVPPDNPQKLTNGRLVVHIFNPSLPMPVRVGCICTRPALVFIALLGYTLGAWSVCDSAHDTVIAGTAIARGCHCTARSLAATDVNDRAADAVPQGRRLRCVY